MGRWLTRFAWLLWSVIVLLALAVHPVGQRSVWIAPVVYSPPQLGVMLLICLAALTFARQWRLSLLCLATALIFAWPVWGWRAHVPVQADEGLAAPDCLRVLTCNRGQHYGHSLAPFIAHLQPDLIALQDAHAVSGVVPQAPEYAALPHRQRVGEFQLLSRYPITRAQLLMSQPANTPKPFLKAARFEVQFGNRVVVVYEIHLPSPRKELRSFVRSGAAEQAAQSATVFWQTHEALLNDFVQRIEAETLPTVVLGDWNQPPLGPHYRRMTQHLQDAHAEAGIGSGFSFPGDWWNPAAFGHVWLRIDYVLCNHAWQVLRCETEPQSNSQHSAVGALLRLR